MGEERENGPEAGESFPVYLLRLAIQKHPDRDPREILQENIDLAGDDSALRTTLERAAVIVKQVLHIS